MKKTLSVLLAVLMLFSMASFTAIAADPVLPEFEQTYTDNVMVLNTEAVISANTRKTIPEGKTLYLDSGAVLYVYGTLSIEGTVISRGGDLIVKYDTENKQAGLLLHPENLVNNALTASDWHTMKRGGTNNAHFFAEICFPSRTDSVYSGLVTNDAHIYSPRYMWSCAGGSYEDSYEVDKYTAVSKFDPDASGFPPVDFVYPSVNGSASVIEVPLNQYIFVQSYITGSNAGAYDASVIKMNFEDVAMDNSGTVNKLRVTTAGAVSYVMRKADANTGAVKITPVKWDSDEDFYKTFRLYLPSGEGYSVFGRLSPAGGGVISADGQTVHLKYGKPFEFKVQIDDKYSESVYEVYLIKGYDWNDDLYTEYSFKEMADEQKDMDPETRFIWDFENLPADGQAPGLSIDEYGYYHIDAVTSDYSVVVLGVAANETIEFAGGLMETLRNIFDAFKRFIDMILGFFHIG